jgi:hypothetical protein
VEAEEPSRGKEEEETALEAAEPSRGKEMTMLTAHSTI